MKLVTTALVIASLALGTVAASAATYGTIFPLGYDPLQELHSIAVLPHDGGTPFRCTVSAAEHAAFSGEEARVFQMEPTNWPINADDANCHLVPSMVVYTRAN